MEPQFKLALDKQFGIESFKREVAAMSESDCKTKLVEIYTKLIYMDNEYKAKVAEQWGIMLSDNL